MKLKIYSRSKGMTGSTIGIEINGAEARGVRDLTLNLSAMKANLCTMSFYVSELDIDVETKAILEALESDENVQVIGGLNPQQ